MYFVEFEGSKGWEVSLETPKGLDALDRFRLLKAEGYNVRLTWEKR